MSRKPAAVHGLSRWRRSERSAYAFDLAMVTGNDIGSKRRSLLVTPKRFAGAGGGECSRPESLARSKPPAIKPTSRPGSPVIQTTRIYHLLVGSATGSSGGGERRYNCQLAL